MFRAIGKATAAGLVALVVGAGVAGCGVPYLACVAGPCAACYVLGMWDDEDDDEADGLPPVGEDAWHTVRSYGE